MTQTDAASFLPQTEPLWVGMMHSGFAVSGRVIGWTSSNEIAPFPRSELPTPKGPRGRAVVLVHATSAEPGLFEPVVSIDAGWRARYVASPEEAWAAALDLETEYARRIAENHHQSREKEQP